MRGRRLGADLLDLLFALPLGGGLGLPVFGFLAMAQTDWSMGGDLRDSVGDALGGPLLSMRLLLASLAVGWAVAFVFARLGSPPTAGELLMGLRPPGERRPRWKDVLSALLIFDLPLGWVLFRPVERVLKVERERDHTRSALEALGNSHRKNPALLLRLGVFGALALLSIPLWSNALERHQRQIISAGLAQWDTWCATRLNDLGIRAWVRAAGWTELLAPEVYREHPEGTRERTSLHLAMALLDGRCGRLKVGDAAPGDMVDGDPVGRRRRILLAGDVGPKINASCYSDWLGGIGSGRTGCGELHWLSDAWTARAASGQAAQCGVYVRDGRIAAVVGVCE